MNILIIGKNSYIGNHIENWLSTYDYCVRQLDVLNEDWRVFDYSPYHSIIHVAGIVHQPQCIDWELYQKVNAEMPVEIATIAKFQGVKQYVFLSTMGVYGIDKQLYSNLINHNTPLHPETMYGRSKLMAEQGLKELQDSLFNVVCIRPPSVYGKGCRGGYITGFTKIASLLPFIPLAFQNVKQSFIYIDNLCELVRLLIENNSSGIYCPQDDKSPNASELLKAISVGLGKSYKESRVLGFFLRLLSFIPLVKKAYGGIEYDRSLSDIPGFDYVIVPFEEGIKRTII